MNAPGRSFLVDVPGVNVLVIDRDTEVRIDDINTVADARAILDRLDAAILQTETALDQPGRAPGWQRQARYSLRVKRLARPRIVARIDDLQRAAKAERAVGTITPQAIKMDLRRRAFLDAAYQMLGREKCAEIWDRAQAIQPAPFAKKDDSK